MRLYRASDIRTDNYIVVSGSRTTAPFIIQEEWNALATKRLWPPPFRSTLARLYLPHIQLVLAYLIEIPSMPLQSKIGGLRRVAVGILKSGKAALVSSPISNRDIAAGGYPIISGWGLIRSPFAPPKRGKPHIFPRKIGVMSVRVQICSRKIPGTGRAVLCFGNVW